MKSTVITNLEVRWGECDPAGIVYHPAYIDWFSVARMHFMKENGVSYMKTFHDAGIVLVVLGVQCRYRKTLRAEDNITVEARLLERTRTRLELQYEVRNEDGDLCAIGTTEHAFVDMESDKACNVAKRAPQLWELLETLPISSSVERA